MKLRGELRFIERALNQGWQVPIAEQQRSIELVIKTLESDKPREVKAALRVLGAMVTHDAATDAEIRKRAQDALRKYGGAK